MHNAGHEGVARSGGVDDTGGDGALVVVCDAVAAIGTVTAQCDVNLVYAHAGQALGGIASGMAVGDGLRLEQVEFQGVQVMCLAAQQRFDDAGRLGGAHRVDKQRRRCATVDEILQGGDGQVSIGDNGSRGVDVAEAVLEK